MFNKILGLLTILNFVSFLIGFGMIFNGHYSGGTLTLLINGLAIYLNGSSIPSLFKGEANV